jgi:hypothetical protein
LCYHCHNTTRGLDNSRYHTKTEFNNCFIIYSKAIERKQSHVVYAFKNMEFSRAQWIVHFPCWYTDISTRVEIGKTRNCVETRRPKGGVFSHNFEFPNFHECWYNLASSAGISPEESGFYFKTHSQAKTHRDSCGGGYLLYLFYNIAQRNIKKEIFRRFRVDIELYQHRS